MHRILDLFAGVAVVIFLFFSMALDYFGPRSWMVWLMRGISSALLLAGCLVLWNEGWESSFPMFFLFAGVYFFASWVVRQIYRFNLAVVRRCAKIFRPSVRFTSQEVADNRLEFTATILHAAFQTVVIRQQLLAEARAMGDSAAVAWVERQLEQAQEVATQYKQSFWRLYNDAKDCGLKMRPPKYQYYVRLQIRVREDLAA